MNDRAAIRAVFPRSTMKRLARLMDIPLDTARHWLFRKVSAARRCELALALLRELDEQDRGERAAARNQLLTMVGDAEVGELLAGEGNGGARVPPIGAPARTMGGSVSRR